MKVELLPLDAQLHQRGKSWVVSRCTLHCNSNMFRRKLIALDYHKTDNFDYTDESEFRNLMLWLEDQKIRFYKIEDRAPLRNINSSDWLKHFEKYLEHLDCPYQIAEKDYLVDWILGYAVKLDYEDNVDVYKGITADSMKNSAGTPSRSENPLDSLDFNDADFKAGVTSLSMLLQVPPHEDHLEQLKAICIMIKERLSNEAIEKSAAMKEGVEVPLEKTDLGFDTGDYVLNDAAKIVRLLHIKELRDLQTQINSAIVAVQALTANPKTDSRLGKVGR